MYLSAGLNLPHKWAYILDLRHSCALLLLAKKVPMKMIQEWLGHSDISTTSNIYSHLDAESKLESADIIGVALSSYRPE